MYQYAATAMQFDDPIPEGCEVAPDGVWMWDPDISGFKRKIRKIPYKPDWSSLGMYLSGPEMEHQVAVLGWDLDIPTHELGTIQYTYMGEELPFYWILYPLGLCSEHTRDGNAATLEEAEMDLYVTVCKVLKYNRVDIAAALLEAIKVVKDEAIRNR